MELEGANSNTRCAATTHLVGLALGEGSLTSRSARGELGSAACGPQQLLADLELRLGLPQRDVSAVERVQACVLRARRAVARGPQFYARSFAHDPLGTARLLLAWRDALVLAGWDGHIVGAERVDALAELESIGAVPDGVPDRLRAVISELTKPLPILYPRLELAEPASLWPTLWQKIFARLVAGGTELTVAVPDAAPVSSATDLGRLQALLRADSVRPAAAGPVLTGDGSLLVVRAETPHECAEVLAALLRADDTSTAVIRGEDAGVLDAALAAQGLSMLGTRSRSRARPLLQVLSLALELAFEPRDPARVLELVTLRGGPFSGRVGHHLARALSEAPGVGGPRWQAATRAVQADLVDDPDAAARAHGRIAAWLEGPTSPATGAPRSLLVDVVDRVLGWLASVLPTGDVTAQVAHREATLFRAVLLADERPLLDLVATRRLLDEALVGQTCALTPEESGRHDHVPCPGALFAVRDTVAWWGMVAGAQTHPATQPWRRDERALLHAAGVSLPDDGALLVAEARRWRQAALAARRRLILVVPATSRGERCEPHPFWSEIIGRLVPTAPELARITGTPADLLAGRGPALPVEALPALALPEARHTWTVPARTIAAAPAHSATSLDALLGCPLRWVLRHAADLPERQLDALPRAHRLNGGLGHRLIEELHRSGAFARPASELHALAESGFDALLAREAATLLLPGMTSERIQLRAQLVTAVLALRELLEAGEMTIAAVEESIDVPWGSARLTGRLDLRLDGPDGEAILDLKWGTTTYETQLRTGNALQLALYVRARQVQTGASRPAPAGYFSLSQARLYTTSPEAFGHGPSVSGEDLAVTWTKVATTAAHVEAALARGTIPVSGVADAPPLLAAAGVAEGEQTRGLVRAADVACEYCRYDAVCGRRWSVFA